MYYYFLDSFLLWQSIHKIYHFDHLKGTVLWHYVQPHWCIIITSVSRTFSSSLTGAPYLNNFPFTLLPTLGIHASTFCLWMWLSASYERNHVILVLLWLAHNNITYYDVFKVHPCCSKYQYCAPFSGRLIFHCLYVPHFIYLLIYQWTLGLLPCFGYCEQCFYECGWTNTFSCPCFHLFWVYTQKRSF